MKRVIIALVIFLIFALANLETLFGKEFKIEEGIEIKADRIVYDYEKDEYEADGEVDIKFDSNRVKADRIIYNNVFKQLQLFGDISLKYKDDHINATYAILDIHDNTGTIENAKMFFKHSNLHIYGTVVQKTGPETYEILDAKITTCDEAIPPWSMTGSRVNITLEGYGKAFDVAFRTREYPVLYTPVIIFPAKTKRQTGLLFPRFGYSSNLGFDVEVPFFWNIRPDMDATFYQRYLSKRGYMQGLEFRYAATQSSKGAFMLDITRHDKKDLYDKAQTDISPYYRGNVYRYWLRSKVDQELPTGAFAQLDLDLVSDQDYLRELWPRGTGVKYRPELADTFLRPVDHRLAPYRTSTVRVSKTDGDRGFYQLQSSYFQRPEPEYKGLTYEPVLSLFQSRWFRQKGLPLIISVESEQRFITREEDGNGYEVLFTPKLMAPISIGPYLNFLSSIRYDLDLLKAKDPVKEEEYKDAKGGFVFASSISTNLMKDFDLKGIGLDVIRHNLVPRVALEYYHYKGVSALSPWTDLFQEWDRGKQVSLSLENYFTGGYLSTPYRFATFNITQGYLMDLGAHSYGHKRDLSPLEANLILTPVKTIDLRGDLAWDHSQGKVTKGAISMEATFDRAHGRQDSVMVSYQMEHASTKTINLQLNLSLPHNFILGTDLSRDLKQNENVAATYYVGYRHQCYSIRFSVDTSQRDTQWGLFVELLGLAEFGGRLP